MRKYTFGQREKEEVDFTKKDIKKIISKKEDWLQKATHLLNTAPEGTLKYQNRDKVTYYYWQRKNQETKKWEKTYLKRAQSKLIKQLAQKSYLLKVKRVLEEQIQALRIFDETYNEDALEQIYEQLPEERKCMVEPFFRGVQEKLRVWNTEKIETHSVYPEYRIYETMRGEMVRSKSEVIIANLLHQYKEDIDYKYERPLKIREKSGNEITIHPDFTIINKHTGKIYYYEHAGRMDEVKYAIDFVKRIELYTANNILQGRDLLVTYEAAGVPLSVSCVKKMLECVVLK